MVPFSHLVLLVAAFFGTDLSGTEMDIDGGYEDPDIVADYCYGYDSEVEDWHNDYAEAWYAWEWCMLADDDGSLAPYDNAYRLGRTEAEALVEEVWERYTPWMRREFSRTLFFPEDDDKPDGDWYQLVLTDDWAPKLPYINTGAKKVREHCSDGDEEAHACSVYPDLTVTQRNEIGESVWWWADSTYDTYSVHTAKLKFNKNGRIVTPKRNRFTILHELAHQIDNWQHVLWEGETAYTVELEEDERTRGHGLEFKCLLLDLYNDYGEDFHENDLWWEDSYVELHRLCQIIAPHYAQPVDD